jgi:hypothetical protein
MKVIGSLPKHKLFIHQKFLSLRTSVQILQRNELENEKTHQFSQSTIDNRKNHPIYTIKIRNNDTCPF